MDNVLTPASNVLLTGATGFIGGELAQRLDGFSRANVWTLVRPRSGEDISARLAERYRRSGRIDLPGPNLHPLAGDVTRPDWGLSGGDLDTVLDGVDVIIHSAADTSFAAQNDTGKTNVEGVRNLIGLASRCRRRPLIVYLGTASNIGEAAHCCLREQDGCQPDNKHFNDYTHSKAVAETLLRESGLPVLTLRPTIVLSAGLPDAGFARQILWCVPLGRCFRCLPIDPESRLDLVDVGFVADAALALMCRPGRRHDCYHLSAGPGNAQKVGPLSEVVDWFYRRKQPLQFVPPAEWTFSHHRKFVRSEMQRWLFRSLRYYLPFMNMDVVYDDSRLREELGDETPEVRPPQEYLPDLLALIRPQAALREAALP